MAEVHYCLPGLSPAPCAVDRVQGRELTEDDALKLSAPLSAEPCTSCDLSHPVALNIVVVKIP